MFLDASAIVAMIIGEPDAEVLAVKLKGAMRPMYCALGHFEAVLAVSRVKGMPAATAVDLIGILIEKCGAQCIPITEEIGKVAISASTEFGKGRHRARLNMGDCFSYACAKVLGVPLLCKGDDFRHTDIQIA